MRFLFAVFILLFASFPAHAQVSDDLIPNGNWWRNCASLDLDFYNDQYYVNSNTICDGTVGTQYSAGGGKSGVQNFIAGIGATFTRNSIATYFDNTGTLKTATANVPRLDHDPVTFAPKGVLIEEARTNSLTYSSDYTQSAWGKFQGLTVTPNATTAPDGTNTAQKLVEGTGNTYFYTAQSLSGGNATYTVSLFAKQSDSARQVYFECGDTRVGFNLTTGTVYSGPSTFGSGWTNPVFTSQALSNGWYRLTLTGTADNTVTSIDAKIHPTSLAGTAVGDIIYQGDGVSGVYVWGVQLEQGTFPTSYIPTTTASVARALDVFKIPVGSWFNAMTGTFFVDSFGQTNSQQHCCARIIGGDGDYQYVGLNCCSTPTDLDGIGGYNDHAAPVIAGLATPFSPTVSHKIGSAWDAGADQWSITTEGATKLDVSLSGGSMSTTYVYIGESQNYDPINASIRRVTFFPLRMPDAALKQYAQ